MTQEMKPYERKLAAILLEMASNHFGNHGCNDFPLEKYLTPEEQQMLTKQYHEWNGDPEEYNPDRPMSLDFALMGFLAAKIYPEEDIKDLMKWI